MASKYILLVSTLCLVQAVFGAGLDDVKKAALEKLRVQYEAVTDATPRDIAQILLNQFSNHTNARVNHANVLSERTHFEIDQVMDSASLSATLMIGPESISECLDEVRMAAQLENEKYVTDRFFTPVRQNEITIFRETRDLMVDYDKERGNLVEDYKVLYESSVKTIKLAENESEVRTILDSIVPFGENVVRFTKEIIGKVSKQLLKNLDYVDNKLVELRTYSRNRVDQMGDEIFGCFLIDSPFKIKKVFTKSQ